MTDEFKQEGDITRHTRRTRTLLESGERVVIVAFGDSITAGYAVLRGFPSFWMQFLKDKYPGSNIEMHNEGFSGDTTLDGLSRLAWSVLPRRPDLVTINFGINDAAYGIGLDEFKENFTEIVERILAECGSEILLLSSQPLLTPHFNRLVLDYYHSIEDVARETGVGFVDVYAAWMARVREGMRLESLILEGLDHPNENGYRIIAEELMRHL